MLIHTFDIHANYSSDLKTFLENCNLLINFVNGLVNYDFTEIISEYLLLKNTDAKAMDTLKVGMEAVKAQLDAKQRHFIYEQLIKFFTEDKHLELLSLSANKTTGRLLANLSENELSQSQPPTDYAVFDEFKRCGAFVLLKANKLAMAAIVIDGLLAQLENKRKLLADVYVQCHALITAAKQQIIACMELHLKVTDMNFQSNVIKQREVIKSEGLDFSIVQLTPDIQSDEFAHQRTIIPNPIEMSIQVLSKSSIGQAIPSDLIAYFHQQFKQLTGNPIIVSPLNPDRTLAEKFENPLLLESQSEEDKKFTVSFFNEYIEEQHQYKPLNHGYLQVIYDLGSWCYQKYYGKQEKETQLISVPIADPEPEHLDITMPAGNTPTHKSHFFSETDSLLKTIPQEDEECCHWKCCTLL